ncbi:hypothetical protein MNBD_GAMMA09-3211 [hydrothermal vent metagenome]|uniref:DUF4384 domain-containing protein n=1 Tax=hydrothermal vent metagenome TaxID=652676 RepID=A0A3B0XLY4_9ZZZZ
MHYFLAIPMHFILTRLILSCLLMFSVVAAAEKNTLQSINIEITSHLGDQQQFQQNDVLSFLLSLDKDAYVYVIYEDALQQLVQIIPNNIQQSHFYKAGFFISVPAENSAFQFIVQPPFGKETLWVFATDSASVTLAGQFQPAGLKRLKADIKSIRKQIKQQSKQIWGEAFFSLVTGDGS